MRLTCGGSGIPQAERQPQTLLRGDQAEPTYSQLSLATMVTSSDGANVLSSKEKLKRSRGGLGLAF